MGDNYEIKLFAGWESLGLRYFMNQQWVSRYYKNKMHSYFAVVASWYITMQAPSIQRNKQQQQTQM